MQRTLVSSRRNIRLVSASSGCLQVLATATAVAVTRVHLARTKSGVRAAAGTGSVAAGTAAAGIGKGLSGRWMIAGGSMGPPVA
jgi:hypothetical protein